MKTDPVSAVVLISAGAEWRALFPELVAGLSGVTPVAASPYGEWFEAQVNRQRVIFLHGGWGKVAAAASTEYAISRWEPQRLLNLGTCGGFAGLAEPGEILLADETIIYDIIEQMGDPQEAIRHYSVRPCLDGLPETLPFPLRRVRLISADRDILPGQIPELIERFGAVAADWESGAIAWVAGRHNLPCFILRGVTDVVSTTGGEAYGDIEVFRSRARGIMQTLFSALGELI
jgi:adenosylhomocysteine nucleosidase